MTLHRFLTFASEAEIVGVWGLICLVISGMALLADKRRARRARIDRLGWVPWLPLFLISAVVGVTLLTLAVKGVLAGW